MGTPSNGLNNPTPFIRPSSGTAPAAMGTFYPANYRLNPSVSSSWYTAPTPIWQAPPSQTGNLNLSQEVLIKKPFKLPITWLVIGGLALWGMALPATVIGVTYLMAQNFLWRFNGQDLVGMGVPRIAKSLERGAHPYNSADDPEAQNRKGLSKQAYILRQRLQHSNWPNLIEEMSRELVSAPGVLAVSVVGIGLMKFLSRVADGIPGIPKGRRALELSTEHLDKLTGAFAQFVEHQGLSEAKTLGLQERTGLLKAFYQHIWTGAADPELLNKKLHFKLNLAPKMLDPAAVFDPAYILSESAIEKLVKADVNGLGTQLKNYKPRLPLVGVFQQAPKAKTETHLSLEQIIEHWSEAMAEHAKLDWTGQKRNPFFGSGKQANELAQAKLNYWSQMLREGVVQLNIQRPGTHQFKLDHWPLQLGKPGGASKIWELSSGELNGGLKVLDRFRDFIISVGRPLENPKNTQPLSKIAQKTLNQMLANKLGTTMLMWASAAVFFWLTDHAIQKGRVYPANRLLQEGVMPQASGALMPAASEATSISAASAAFNPNRENPLTTENTRENPFSPAMMRLTPKSALLNKAPLSTGGPVYG